MDDCKITLALQFPVEYYGGKYKYQIIDELIGRGNVYALVRTLHNQTDDFPGIYANYKESLKRIGELIGGDPEKIIKKLEVAIDMKCGENMFWCGLEGLKMNYRHFIDPYAPNCTWRNVDYDDYLRIEITGALPACTAADGYIESVRKMVEDKEEDAWDAVNAYEVALELCGMKLAHYYGYLAGNDILRHYVPAYHSDPALDLRYRSQLEDYFGCPLRTDEWDGAYRIADWVVAPIQLSDPVSDAVLREEILKGV